MPTYPTYKLGEIAKIYNGNSINAEEKEKKYKGVDGRNYIGTKDIDFDGSVNYNNGVRIPYNEEKFKIAPAESVLVCAEGGSAGKKSAFITEDVCFGNKLFAITNNQGLFDGKYVFYYTRYKRFFDLFKNELSGLIGGVSSKKFGEIPIPLPPLPTQHATVSRIETLFAELDKAVQHLRTARQQLKTFKQAVLNYWLNNEDGKWETVKLGEVAEKIQIGPFGTQLHKSDYIHGGIPLINPMHICNKKILPDYSFSVSNDKYKELTNYYLKKDDVVLGRRGEMGRCAVVSEKEDGMLCGTGSLFIRGGKLLNATYLCHLLSSQKIVSYFENSSSGTTMSNLNQGIIRSCEISFPPLSDQQRIVQEIESRLSQAEAAEARIAESLQKTEALRQSILKKAFSGELV
jgi:type I restriction enzyme S subunit